MEATAAYRKALELNPNSGWSFFHLGETLSKLQKWDEAIAAYQQTIKLNPNSGSFHLFFILNYYENIHITN